MSQEQRVVRYKDFNYVNSTQVINEGLFDSLKNLFAKMASMFKDTTNLYKQIDAAEVASGSKDDNVTCKSIKIGTTLFVKLENPSDDTKKLLLSFTKLADMPDGSGLFQITGTDSKEFMTAINITDINNLNTVGVIAIISPSGFVKDKPISMRVYKNVSKDGKPTETDSVVKAALSADDVLKIKPE